MPFTIRATDWESDGEALASVRRRVFIVEQDVPKDLELDGLDPLCKHAIAIDVDSGDPVGAARLDEHGHIGRVAVLAEHRHRGIGSQLMECLIETARANGFATVELHSQSHAVAFYEQHGFVKAGDEFVEAGIPHVLMQLTFSSDD